MEWLLLLPRSIDLWSSKNLEYFRLATPELEYGRMNIGSRPSKRKPSGGIESLRAISWIFAWTLTRFHLPVWLDLGAAFKYAIKKDVRNLHMLQDMYKHWPFFQVTIDLIETLESLHCTTSTSSQKIYGPLERNSEPTLKKPRASSFRIRDQNYNVTLRPHISKEIMQSSKSAQELVTLNPKSEYAPGLEDPLILTMKGIAKHRL
ncbi:hypothetical protein F2Q69_00038329, partial [Brassica cretica]